MKLIKVKIDYDGEVKLNNECTVKAPLEMRWFPDNDLVVETRDERIVFNSTHPVSPDGEPPLYIRGEYFVVTPRVAEKKLVPVEGVDFKIMKNNVAVYLVVDGKRAFRLPRGVLE